VNGPIPGTTTAAKLLASLREDDQSDNPLARLGTKMQAVGGMFTAAAIAGPTIQRGLESNTMIYQSHLFLSKQDLSREIKRSFIHICPQVPEDFSNRRGLALSCKTRLAKFLTSFLHHLLNIHPLAVSLQVHKCPTLPAAGLAATSSSGSFTVPQLHSTLIL
jgi:hypothetical protein